MSSVQLDSNPEALTPEETEDPEAQEKDRLLRIGRERANSLRDVLKLAPGNDELDAFFAWENSTKEPYGDITRIPFRKNPDNRLMFSEGYQELHEICGGAAACSSYDGALVLPSLNALEEQGFYEKDLSPIYRYKKSFAEQLEVPAYDKMSEQQKAVYLEGMLLHELQHADSQKREFHAFRRMFDYYAEQGLCPPVDNERLLSHIFKFYYDDNYVTSVVEFFGGDTSNPEMKRWLPGGDRYKGLVEELKITLLEERRSENKKLIDDSLAELKKSPPDSWNNPLGTKASAFLVEYFAEIYDREHKSSSLSASDSKTRLRSAEERKAYITSQLNNMGVSEEAIRKGFKTEEQWRKRRK